MSRSKAIVGLCVLCALLVSAFAVQSASAATKGTTAFTCVQGAGAKELWGEHCLGSNPGSGEKQEYGHVAISENVVTHATLTNAKTKTGTTESTPIALAVVLGGIPIRVTASEAHTTPGASLVNKKDAATGEHYTEIEAKIRFSNATTPELPNCKVVGIIGGKEVTGEIETEELLITTKGQGMDLLFGPKTGTVITEFKLVNNGGTCVAASTDVLVGSFKGQPDMPGATVALTHSAITAEKTLHLGSAKGPVAGLEGKLTVKAGIFLESEVTRPISPTTVETP